MKSTLAACAWTMAAPAALGPAVVFLLGPHIIFTTNPDEFAVGFGELAAPWLLRAAALGWLVLLGIGCAIARLSERAARVYAAVLFALGLLLWAQGHLWNAEYGPLTGDDVDLASHDWRAPYELAAWAVVLAAAIVFSRPVSRMAPFVATAFLGVQLVAGGIVRAEPEGAARGRWVDPPPAIYEFSAERNVVHVVLDAFQSDVFSDLLEQDRGAFDRRFDGFEYFVDHAASFPTTAFSMVAMLTGETYRNQRPAPVFARRAFRRSSSLFERMSRAGYDIDAISIVPAASLEQWLGPERRPNWRGARFRVRKPFVRREDYREATAGQLLELSLFRHVPHAAKAGAIEWSGTFSRAAGIGRVESPARVRQHHASNSAAFFEHFTGSMTVGRSRPVYKLLHLGVPHRPVVLDGECRFIGPTRTSRETFGEQARCALRRVSAFLDRLRALGIYDSSLIIISSDHGTGLRSPGFNGRSDSLSTDRLSTMAGTAKALMLVKPPGRRGPLALSEAPTSHVDLPATILDLLGVDGGLAGESMFRRDAGRPRVRSFGMYPLNERFPRDYYTRLDVMTLDRRIVDAAGWTLQRSVWRPGLTLGGSTIDIGTDPRDLHIGPGWTDPQRGPAGPSGEVTFVQAGARRAVLFATLPSGPTEIVLRAASALHHVPRSVRVHIDGRTTVRLDLPPGDGYGDLSIEVPAHSARPPISQITLEFETESPDRIDFRLDRLTVRDR